MNCNVKPICKLFPLLAKDSLEQLELPLSKIYASEQIRRVEKYIEARPQSDNKGYKEQIVEIAVEYQIDSKYTAFIAVNERDEKLTDIPVLQETVLESPSGWDMDCSTPAQRLYPVFNCVSEKSNYSDKSSRVKAYYCAEPKMKMAEANSNFKNKFLSVLQSLFEEEPEVTTEPSVIHKPAIEKVPADFEDAFEKLFQKIKDCEALIVKKEDYQTLLDEIIESLKYLISFCSKDYRKWIKKIEMEAPQVYDLVKSYLNPDASKPILV